MSAARDYQPLPAILLDSDWTLDFLFFGADTSSAADFAVGSTFDLVLAPAGQAKPASGDVISVTPTLPALNDVLVSVPKATLQGWKPGAYDVQLRRTGPGTVFEPLYVGTISIFTGLSQVAANGGGAKMGRLPGVPGTVQVFRDSDIVHVVRGEAAGSAAAATAAWQAIDPVVTAVTPINVAIPSGQARDVFAASASAKVRWARNRGPGDATVVVGGTAAGASSEISLLAGEEYRPPYRSGLRVSLFAVPDPQGGARQGCTIEGEEGA